MATLFISDLHLCPNRPQVSRLFRDFLAGPARQAETLYVLGDLFEYWAGDDDLDETFSHIDGMLRRARRHGERWNPTPREIR